MIGMDRHTGRTVDGLPHLAQSIHDILTTPKGSVVMNRAYGSVLPDIIDQPINGETMIDLYMATAEAVAAWEPRIDLVQVKVAKAGAGFVELELTDASGQVIPMPIDVRAVA